MKIIINFLLFFSVAYLVSAKQDMAFGEDTRTNPPGMLSHESARKVLQALLLMEKGVYPFSLEAHESQVADVMFGNTNLCRLNLIRTGRAQTNLIRWANPNETRITTIPFRDFTSNLLMVALKRRLIEHPESLHLTDTQSLIEDWLNGKKPFTRLEISAEEDTSRRVDPPVPQPYYWTGGGYFD